MEAWERGYRKPPLQWPYSKRGMELLSSVGLFGETTVHDNLVVHEQSNDLAFKHELHSHLTAANMSLPSVQSMVIIHTLLLTFTCTAV